MFSRKLRPKKQVKRMPVMLVITILVVVSAWAFINLTNYLSATTFSDQVATWTTKGDFENNASTTGRSTTRSSSLNVSGSSQNENADLTVIPNTPFYGNGSDGALNLAAPAIPAGSTYTLPVTRSAVSATSSAGQKELNVSSTSGFAAGQRVLIAQMLHNNRSDFLALPNSGQEEAVIESVSAGKLIMTANLKNTYYADADSKAQVIKINQYTGVYIYDSITLTVDPWDGSTGGILYFYANSAVLNIPGTKIDLTGKGYRSGEGPGGALPGNGGGGGAYGGDGGDGAAFGSPGLGGASYGTESKAEYMGSGGSSMSNTTGGRGGGRIKIVTPALFLYGNIEANGKGGAGGDGWGAGGSGGGIYLAAPDIDLVSAYISAAGAGGSGLTASFTFEAGADGLNGIGGNGGGASAGLGGLPGSPPGAGGDGYQGGGFSAGGGGNGAGGGAGRIAIYYGSFNSVTNGSVNGYADAPDASSKVGPYAYYTYAPENYGEGSIGGSGGNVGLQAGLQVNARGKAYWKEINYSSDPLTAGQKVEFQIRGADTVEGLTNATFIGPDGTSNTWFDSSNKTIPSSFPSYRYAELQLKLTTTSGVSPVVHSVSLSYVEAGKPDYKLLDQLKTDLTKIEVGKGTSEDRVVLKHNELVGAADSGQMKAQFEIKPVNQVFDGSSIAEGGLTASGGDSQATVLLPRKEPGNVALSSPYTKSTPADFMEDTGNLEFTDANLSEPFAFSKSYFDPLTVDLDVDLGQIKSVYQATLYSGAMTDEYYEVPASRLEILTSTDGSTYTSRGYYAPGYNKVITVTFAPVSARYVRFRTGNDINFTSYLYIREGQVFAQDLTKAEEGAYHWRARAVDEQGRTSPWTPFGGNSDGGAQAQAEADFYVDYTNPTQPGTPTTYTPTFDKTPTFNWSASTDSLSGIKGYNVNISSNPPGVGQPDIINNAFTSTNSYTPANPINPGTYYVWAEAVDNAGNKSSISGAGSVQINSIKDLVTAAPRNINVGLVNSLSQSVDIRWDAPLTGDVAYYKVYRSFSRIDNTNKAAATIIGTTANQTFVDINTYASKTYYYQVAAVDPTGDESNVATLLIADSDKIRIPAVESATWTSQDDFENNNSTTGEVTTKTDIDTSTVAGDVKLNVSLTEAGDPDTEGSGTADLVVDGTTLTLAAGTYEYRNVTIKNGGVLTHTANDFNGIVLRVKNKLDIDATSKIDVSAKGWPAGLGIGPGINYGGGGGYGNTGGNDTLSGTGGGAAYGAEDGTDNMWMGSGGDSWNGPGGAGGGRIKVVAKSADIAGSIQANGEGGTNGGGGSGGAIFLKASTINLTGYLSAAGGGGSFDWTKAPDGYSGFGGNGLNSGNLYMLGGAPGSPPGAGGGNQGPAPGPSAGGGGGWNGGAGGAAGRIVVRYGTYNGDIVNQALNGYASSPKGGIVGPFAYYHNLPSQTTGYIGGDGAADKGLCFDAQYTAKWLGLDINAEPLVSGQNIQFQVRTADTSAGLSTAPYKGPDGTSSSWFDLNNASIPDSFASTRFIEIKLRLSTTLSYSPIIHSINLNYDSINPQPSVDLEQLQQVGPDNVKLEAGSFVSNGTLTFKALGLAGAADSTSLKAQFEIKPLGTSFNESGLIDGILVSPGQNSQATTTLAQGAYHWQARVVDNLGRTSPWTSFGGNNESDTDVVVDTTAPGVPGTPSTTTPTNNNKPPWSWTASTDLSGIKGYNAYLGTTPTSFDIVNGTFVDTNAYTYANALDSGDYYLAVEAIDKAGNISQKSDVGTVNISFGLPSNLNVVAQPTNPAIDISWRGPSLSDIDHYNIYRLDERITDANKAQATKLDEVKAFTYTDTNTSAGETYYYQITAVGTDGTEGGLSVYVKSDNATASNKLIEGGPDTPPHWGFSPTTGLCKNCHTVHLAKGSKKIFRKTPNIEICFTCHDGSGSAFDIKSYFKDKGAHDLNLSDPQDTFVKCTNCHHPHNAENWLGQGGGERMTRAKEEELCLKCHNELPNDTDSTTPGHSKNNWDIKAQFNLDKLTEETHTAPTQGKTCQECHGPTIKGFNYSRHAITGTTADGLSGAKIECSSCHGPHSVQRGDAGSDHSKRLVDPNNTFNLWTGSFTEFCLNCHRSDNLPQKSGQSDPKFAPFTIQFPQVLSPFFAGWDKTAFKDNPGAHSQVVLDQSTGKKMTCQKCHHPHGSQNSRLNAFFDEATKSWDVGEKGYEENLCLQCHKAGNTLGAPDIDTVLNKTTKHPVKDRRDRHKDTEVADDIGKENRHAECVDCHDPHQARAGLHKTGSPFAGGPLTGMPGIGILNGIPGVSQNILYPLRPIVYEYQLCFKCHSSYVELLDEPQGDLKYKPQDKAAEFNTNNPSFHPVEGLGKNLGIKDEAFTSGTPWNPTPDVFDASGNKISGDDPDYGLDANGNVDPSYKGNINCTDCHNNSDPAGAQGPHGSDNRKLLKAPFYYVEEPKSTEPGCSYMGGCHKIRAINYQGGTDGNRLCFKCHNEDVYVGGAPGSRFFGKRRYGGDGPLHPYHLNNDMYNNGSCFNCHKIHGSDKKPHLLKSDTDTGQNWTYINSFTENADNTISCSPNHHYSGPQGLGNHSYAEEAVRLAYPHVQENLAGVVNYGENSSGKITYTGSWWQIEDSLAVGGRYAYAPNLKNNNSAGATLSFSGTKVSWYSKRGIDGALAQIYVDGSLVKEIDLVSLTDNFGPVFESDTLPAGSHSISIKLKFREQTNIAGTSATSQKLILDSFKVTP